MGMRIYFGVCSVFYMHLCLNVWEYILVFAVYFTACAYVSEFIGLYFGVFSIFYVHACLYCMLFWSFAVYHCLVMPALQLMVFTFLLRAELWLFPTE